MQRTLKQNDSLHLWFEQVAEALNDAGLDMRAVLKPEIAIPWSKESIKDFLWRPVQQAYLQKKSTTELETKDIDKIFDILTRHLGEKFGLTVPFPSVEEAIDYENISTFRK